MQPEEKAYQEQLAGELSVLEVKMQELDLAGALKEGPEKEQINAKIAKIKEQHQLLKDKLKESESHNHEIWDEIKDVVKTTHEEMKLAVADIDNWVATGKHE